MLAVPKVARKERKPLFTIIFKFHGAEIEIEAENGSEIEIEIVRLHVEENHDLLHDVDDLVRLRMCITPSLLQDLMGKRERDLKALIVLKGID